MSRCPGSAACSRAERGRGRAAGGRRSGSGRGAGLRRRVEGRHQDREPPLSVLGPARTSAARELGERAALPLAHREAEAERHHAVRHLHRLRVERVRLPRVPGHERRPRGVVPHERRAAVGPREARGAPPHHVPGHRVAQGLTLLLATARGSGHLRHPFARVPRILDRPRRVATPPGSGIGPRKARRSAAPASWRRGERPCAARRCACGDGEPAPSGCAASDPGPVPHGPGARAPGQASRPARSQPSLTRS